MSYEQFTERWTQLTKEWVRLDGEASKLEKLEKLIFSEMVQREQGSVAAREHAVRADAVFRDHCLEAIGARTQANIARAEADGMKMRFEAWRTISATKRAEMNLV